MKRELIENNPVLKLSFEFALLTIRFTEELEKLRKFNLANQLFRSGTAIGAHAKEAQNAESRADFIHKMKLAAKEAEETQYWLMLCEATPGYPPANALLEKLELIGKLLTKILQTANANR